MQFVVLAVALLGIWVLLRIVPLSSWERRAVLGTTIFIPALLAIIAGADARGVITLSFVCGGTLVLLNEAVGNPVASSQAGDQASPVVAKSVAPPIMSPLLWLIPITVGGVSGYIASILLLGPFWLG